MKRTALLVVISVATLATPVLFARGQAPAQPAAATPAAAAPQGGRGGGRGGGPVVSPEVSADRRITFRFRAPNADAVAIQMGGRGLPMTKDEQGVWSVTTDPMNPDMYTYSVSVNGANINDPNNRQVQTSFAGFSSMVVVPGPAAYLPAAGVPKGAITKHTYHSNIANDDRNFFVYTPADYDARRSRPYPVLYLLHGLGDDAERWLAGGGGAANILDNLIASKTAVPMVVVSPLGYGTNQGPAGGRGASNVTGYSEIFIKELMPMVDRAYNVTKNRQERAIAGLSMGGAETLFVGLNNLDRFAWIAAFSSAPQLWPAIASAQPPPTPAAATAPPATGAAAAGRGAGPAMEPALIAQTFPALSSKDNSRIRMLWIVCGTADGLIVQNRQFKDWLKSQNINYTEQEVPDMAHVWPLWRQNVTDLLPKLFQARAK